MDIFLFSVNAVLPLVLIVVIGYFLKRLGILDEGFINKANKLCFMVAFPLQLFYNIYHIDLTKKLNPSFLLFIILSIIASVLLLSLIVPRFVKDSGKCGAFIQGAYRSNFLLIGLPLAKNLFGESGVAVASIALPIVVPIYNFIAVVVLTIFGNKNKAGIKVNYIKLLIEIIKNPLIIASILGLILSLVRFPIPVFLDRTIRDVGSIATPFALILLGGQFSSAALKGRLKLAVVASFLRVLLLPTIVIGLAGFLGFRGTQLGTILIIFATPTAISSFIMAKNMNNDSELAGQIIILTTILSSFTLFVWIFLLRMMDWI